MSAIDLLWIALLVAFIVLKLCGVINWAWVWVLSPLWIALAIVAVYAIVLFVKVWIKTWREMKE